MMLVKRGKLRLDEPIDRLAPEQMKDGEPILGPGRGWAWASACR